MIHLVKRGPVLRKMTSPFKWGDTRFLTSSVVSDVFEVSI